MPCGAPHRVWWGCREMGSEPPQRNCCWLLPGLPRSSKARQGGGDEVQHMGLLPFRGWMLFTWRLCAQAPGVLAKTGNDRSSHARISDLIFFFFFSFFGVSEDMQCDAIIVEPRKIKLDPDWITFAPFCPRRRERHMIWHKLWFFLWNIRLSLEEMVNSVWRRFLHGFISSSPIDVIHLGSVYEGIKNHHLPSFCKIKILWIGTINDNLSFSLLRTHI